MRILLLLLCGLLGSASFAQSVEDFARLPALSSPQLSPNGESVAYIITHEDRPVIVTRDLTGDPDNQNLGVIPFDDTHVMWHRWANDNRLIVAVRMNVTRPRVGQINLLRLMALDRDGGNPLVFAMEPNKWGHFLQLPKVIDILPEDPHHILMMLDHNSDSWFAGPVHKVNIETGKKTLFDRNSQDFWRIITDDNNDIRIGMKAGSRGNLATYYRKEAGAPWRLLQRTSIHDNEGLRPVRIDHEDPNILIFTSREKEHDGDDPDERHLFRYDLTKHEVIGPHYDKVRTDAKAVFKKNFPNQEVSLVSWTDDITLDKAFYRIHSDVHPPQYFLYNIPEKRIDFFGSAYPQLESVKLSEMKLVNYKARDDLTIPAFLTIPQSAKSTHKPKLPLVVYPHGGPWARDHWGFDNYVQFFAHQGYAVFQPQFRGSTGFGVDHLEAGNEQWGLKIQDDITDGVQWLIDEGIVDAERICIVGASFGGYAAAMGLIKTPELYRCGISINGVLDMQRMLRRTNYTMFGSATRKIINSKWGVKNVSPYHQHKHLDTPLLLIAGEKDTVVESAHSERLYRRLNRRKKPVEYIELPNGEHWRSIESNEIVQLKAMQAFLAQHIGRQPANKR